MEQYVLASKLVTNKLSIKQICGFKIITDIIPVEKLQENPLQTRKQAHQVDFHSHYTKQFL